MEIGSFAVFCVALALNAGAPGPSVAALVARVLAKGARDVLPFLAAMWIGEVVWLMMALAGLSTLAERFHAAFNLLRWAGVGYLVWLAVKMWRQPAAPPDGEANARSARGDAAKMFATGLALTLGNPKIMVFYLALLPSLLDLSKVDLGVAATLMGLTFATLAAVDLAWVAAASRARRLLSTPRALRLANRSGALALGGAAAVIATRN
jgi:threonine/homoserine/homoserine lactone efflux protein